MRISYIFRSPIKNLLFFLALSLTGVSVAQSDIRLTLGHANDAGSLQALSAEEFARRANERLDGYTVQVFGSSQMGNDTELLQRLLIGTVDMAMPSTVMSSEVPEFAVFEMPYLVRDREHMNRIEQAFFWDELAPLAEQKGFKILGLWENGFRHLTTSRVAVTSPEHLQGLRIRTPGSPWRLAMFQAYGANPSPMEFSEVFLALQTGVMDGQENPFSQIYTSRFYEVQRHLSLTRHVYTPLYLTSGSNRFSRLPEEVQEILISTAREMQDFVYETAERLENELLLRLRESDIQIHEVDTDAFIDASAAVYERFAREVPAAGSMVERAVELGRID